MTEHKKLGDQIGAKPKQAGVATEEERAAMVSAYLDGELVGKDLEDFELRLKSDLQLQRDVEEMRAIELRLMEMGADILAEPLPESMLEPFSKLGRG